MTDRFRLFRLVPMRAVCILFALAAALPLAGCADEDNLQGDQPVERLYNAAMDKMADEYYADAAKLFEQVEQQHPYSVWATRAELMAAYADYEGLRYEDAIDALTRFIELHPGNPHVDYAYYMRALCWYEQIADIRRDQKSTQQAFEGFTDVMRRFPGSSYARDAGFKLELARDHLAAKDMDIGRWYQSQGNYIAAINRFKNVVERFQITNQIPEALERLTESYLELGMRDEAQKAAAVLGYNYPDTDWYKQAYGLMTPGVEIKAPDEPGLVSRVWDSLF